MSFSTLVQNPLNSKNFYFIVGLQYYSGSGMQLLTGNSHKLSIAFVLAFLIIINSFQHK